MSDPVDALLCDLLVWTAKQDRPYTEVMEAWRTSCPRLGSGRKRINAGSCLIPMGSTRS